MKTQLTDKNEVRLAVQVLIDLYNRHVSKLNPDLGLHIVVEPDRTYMCYSVQLWYTSMLAPYSHDPRLQAEDERDHLDILIPVDTSIERLENEVTEILNQLSQVKIQTAA